MNQTLDQNDGTCLDGTDPEVLAKLSDRELLDAWVKDRFAPALAVLVQRYNVMVLSVCRRRCRTEADAEDAFQTTFLYLARNGHKIRRAECLPGWLHRVAQRAASASLKQSAQTVNQITEPAIPDNPLERLAQRHEVIALDEELATLPEHYRSAIVMHMYQDLSISKLAEVLGVSIGMARGRLQRGKRLLAQRLRRRGIVPVTATIAASAWTSSTAKAAEATEALLPMLNAQTLPSPPISLPPSNLFNSTGAHPMTVLWASAGAVTSSLLLAYVLLTGGDAIGESAVNHTDSGERETLSIASIPSDHHNNAQFVAQLGAQPSAPAGRPTPAVPPPANPNSVQEEYAEYDIAPIESGAMMGTGFDPSFQPPPGMGPGGMVNGNRVILRTEGMRPRSAIARRALSALDESFELSVRATVDELPKLLQQQTRVPVLLDPRGVQFAQANGASVDFEGDLPLRTALRQMLEPIGLKAIIEEEGIVITADPVSLARKGIGVARWISIDDEAAKRISDALDQQVDIAFIETPLDEVCEELSSKLPSPMVLDRRSLEEIGIDATVPITSQLDSVTLRSALDLMFADLDLTYTIRGESLVLTTLDAADTRLLSRVYWLEATGLFKGDFNSVMDTIQMTVEPDTWEALGGPSSMSPVITSRPALVVRTTYTVHQTIDAFFQTLRDSHFGNDPPSLPLPAIIAPTRIQSLHGSANTPNSGPSDDVTNKGIDPTNKSGGFF